MCCYISVYIHELVLRILCVLRTLQGEMLVLTKGALLGAFYPKIHSSLVCFYEQKLVENAIMNGYAKQAITIISNIPCILHPTITNKVCYPR
jgi:hypothetical protein